MIITANDYLLANKIFHQMLKTGELTEKKHKELYLSYINKPEVREAMECIKEAHKVNITLVGETLYLIPHLDNEILGFNYKEEPLLGNDLSDVYLSYLVMTVIFSEFTNDLCPRAYITPVEIMNLVTESLERSANKEDIKNIEVNNGFNILAIKANWDAKEAWGEEKRGKKTTSKDYKIGVVRKVVQFLAKEGLVKYFPEEDKVADTEKFRNKMNGHFLDEERKELIEELFIKKEEVNE